MSDTYYSDPGWRSRVPSGSNPFDYSLGSFPTNVGSDWNAPFRGQPQPIPPSGSIRIGGGGGGPIPINDPTGTLSSVPGRTLNTTGPEIYPPNNRPINPTRQVGPYTGGTATDAQYSDFDPRSWFRADPTKTFAPGQPMNGPGGPAVGGGGGGNWFGGLGSSLTNLGPGIIPGLAGLTSALGWKYGDPALQKMSVDPRLDAAGSGGFDVTQPLGAPQSGSPQRAYDPTMGSGGISPAPNPYGAGMPRGTQFPPDPAAIGSPAPAVPPPRPRGGGGGRAKPAAPQAIGLGHYIPTTGVGRGAGSYVTPSGAVIAPGPLNMFRGQ